MIILTLLKSIILSSVDTITYQPNPIPSEDGFPVYYCHSNTVSYNPYYQNPSAANGYRHVLTFQLDDDNNNTKYVDQSNYQTYTIISPLSYTPQEIKKEPLSSLAQEEDIVNFGNPYSSNISTPNYTVITSINYYFTLPEQQKKLINDLEVQNYDPFNLQSQSLSFINGENKNILDCYDFLFVVRKIKRINNDFELKEYFFYWFLPDSRLEKKY